MLIAMTINIGIIGTGGMGTRHAMNLHTKIVDAKVVALSDIDATRAKDLAQVCAMATFFSDPIKLIQDERVEAVLIASPDFTHTELTLACLKAGKPVLCEKPLASSAADAKSIVDAEVALGKKLTSVGFMRRFDPEHQGVQEAIATGILGRPLLFKGAHRNAQVSNEYRSEMGVTGSAVHDFDSARWLLGQEVETVYATGVRTDSRLQEKAYDLLTFHLGLTNNTLASIEVYVNAAYGYEVLAEIVGEQGTAITAQPARAITRVKNKAAVPIAADWLVRFQDAYITELENWLASLQGEAFRGASAWDGYMSLLVVDAAIKSLMAGTVEAVPRPHKPALYS